MATKVFTWNGPTTYSDGSPFGSDDLAGFQIVIDDSPPISYTPAFNPSNTYSYTAEVGFGTHTVSVATVASNGQVSTAAQVSFTVVDDRVPNPPTSLQVA